MRTLTLVLDSDQGVGSANRFTINLNDAIKGCVHAQLRQVILTGLAPASDYVYIRSSKLGSTVISGQGFGAFDVVPVSKPFRYERYSTAPIQNEFECGRVLDRIDVALVNPDNSLVALAPTVRITNPNVFAVAYNTVYADGSSDGDVIPVTIPVGSYSANELVSAIRSALLPVALPQISFGVSLNDVLNVTMDWASPNSDAILVSSPKLFNGVVVSATYNTLPNVVTPALPVSVALGTYTENELLEAIQTALLPTATAIENKSSGAVFNVSLSPTNQLVLNLNWKCLSVRDQVLIQDTVLFSGVGVTTHFTNLPSLTSPLSPVTIPTGAYTAEKLVAAVEDALSLTAQAITSTFRHGEFFVSVSPTNDLIIQLNWVCKSYGSTVALPTLHMIENVVVTASFSDGSTQVTSNVPALAIPEGDYTSIELENAITNSLAPVATAMMASSNYNSAVFSTDITDNVVTVNLDWVCSSYSDMVAVPATTFEFSVDVRTYQVLSKEPPPGIDPGFYTYPTDQTTTNVTSWTVSVPAGNYSKGDIIGILQSEINGNISSVSVTFNESTMNLAFYGGFLSLLEVTEIRYNDGAAINDHVGTHRRFGYSRLTVTGSSVLLGISPIDSGIPTDVTAPSTTNYAITVCPSFPPALTGVNGQMTFSDGNYTLLGLPPFTSSTVAGVTTFVTNPLTSENTQFNASGLQQRCSWTFPSPVQFPVLTDVVPVMNVPSNEARNPDFNNGWVVGAPVIVDATTEQYAFKWSIPLTFPQLVSASAVLTYDGNSPMNRVLGLENGVGEAYLDASATNFANGQEQFTWTFPNPMSVPTIQSVNASIINSSSEIGGNGTAPLSGTQTVFTPLQRRIDWEFPHPPVSTTASKATVVVEITTL